MKRIVHFLLALSLTVILMIQCNVIWKSPKTYKPKGHYQFNNSIMTLEEYTSTGIINKHARPYFFSRQSKITKGAVLVFGLDHTKNPADRQLLKLKEEWKKFDPTTALVEGRLGFLFKWAQDPVEKLGEGGLTAKLAKSSNIKLYSWDPERSSQVEYLLKYSTPAYTAAYFCLRPYLNNYSNHSRDEQDKLMRKFIKERTAYKDIRGVITSVDQIDSIWNAVYPDEVNWRNYQHPANGWPKGKFSEIAERMNLFRDEYLCSSIIELVNKGERVFISMGVSHAVCIEKTLKEAIQ